MTSAEPENAQLRRYLNMLAFGKRNDRIEASQDIAECGLAALEPLRLLREDACAAGEDRRAYSVLWALSALGPPALEAIVTAAGHSRPGVRSAAATMLGRVGGASVVEMLLSLLRQDSSAHVRISAARALGEVGDPRIVEPLIAMRHTPEVDGEPFLVEAIGEALHMVREAAAPLLAARVRDYSQGPESRRKELYLLANLYQRDQLDLFTEIVGDRSEADMVRQGAAYGLGQLKDIRGVQPLLRVLLDRKEAAGLRKEVAQVLGRMRKGAAIEGLVTVLGDREEVEDVRVAAATALGALGSPLLQPLGFVPADDRLQAALVGALDDPNARIRGTAADALGRVGDARALPALAAVPETDTAVYGRGTVAVRALDARLAIERRIWLAQLTPLEREERLRRRRAEALNKAAGDHPE